MAHENHVNGESYRDRRNDSVPTPFPPAFPLQNVTEDSMTNAADTLTEQTGRKMSDGSRRPTSKIPEAGTGRSTAANPDDYAAATPIDMPRPKADGEALWPVDNAYFPNGSFQNGSYEDKAVEEYLQNRRPSISFSPEVKTDSGDLHHLDSPLPKPGFDLKRIDKLAFKEQERYPARPTTFHRTFSEADISGYDKVTGERLRYRRSPFNALEEEGAHSIPSEPIENHRKQDIQPKLDILTTDHPHSLTSEATISPIAEEVQTPPDTMALTQSPVSAFPPFAYPTSLEDSSAWPKPQRRDSSRASPLTIEGTHSSRNSVRRQTTRRSNSSPNSPANAFLSRFASNKESRPPSPDDEGQVVGEYVLGRQLGFGGFSIVKEAFTLEGDEKIVRAAKIVRKQLQGKDESENDRLQAEFEHEVEIWRCLGHRNILPLIEVYDTAFATFCFTKLNSGGTLFDKIKNNRDGLSADLAKRYAYQLASAIRYLHEDVHVVHRDIKLENCLIDTSDPDTAKDGGNILLCDFGLAEFVANDLRSNSPDPYSHMIDRPQPPHHISPGTVATSIAGSLQYASPELIMSPAGFLSPVVDIWAFGVVMYAIMVGDLPFQHTFQPRVQMMILAGEWDVKRVVESRAAREEEEAAAEFVGACLDMSSDGRWNIGQVLNSRWLRGMQEMLEEREGGFKL